MTKAELKWLDARISKYRALEVKEMNGAKAEPPQGTYAVAGLYASAAGALEEFRREFFRIPKNKILNPGIDLK